MNVGDLVKFARPENIRNCARRDELTEVEPMRIEIIPDNWVKSPESRRGDGTPTIDVCNECAYFFKEGQASPLYLQERYPGSAVGSTDVDHPPYEDDDYACDYCGDTLTTKNGGA